MGKKETDKKFGNAHEKTINLGAGHDRKGLNEEKVKKERESIKAIKEKQRMRKLMMAESGQTHLIDEEVQAKIDESHNKWKDTHEAKIKVRKADSSKWDVDHEKIAKNKAELAAIKEKRKSKKSNKAKIEE